MMTRISAGSILALFLILFGPCALAATWTVTSDGYNTTDGEEGNSLANNEGSLPFCMLNAADNDTIVFSGDMTINVVGGDAEPFGDALEAYYGTALARTDPTWVITQNGLTIDGTGHNVVLDAGFDPENEPTPLLITPALLTAGTANVTIRGLEITGTPVGVYVGPTSTTQQTDPDATGNLVEDCVIHGCRSTNWGACIEVTVPQTIVRGNECYDSHFGVSVNYATSPFTRVDGTIIEDNTIHGNWRGLRITGFPGTEANPRTRDITVRNNFFYGQIRRGAVDPSNPQYQQSGTDAILRGQISDIYLYGNVFGFDRQGNPQPTRSDAGVEVQGSATHPTCNLVLNEGIENITIGGTEPGQGNLFANSNTGIVLAWIAKNLDVNTAIRGNYIFNQYYTPEPDWSGKAIWWGYDPTTSSPVDPAEPPVITGLNPIAGTSETDTVVDVFVTDVPTETGEEAQCRTYLGTVDAADGTWSLDADVESLFPGLLVTATATRTNPDRRDTSEVSDPFTIPGDAKLDTDNDGMPDDYEMTNGLDPDNPLDAFVDASGDWTYEINTYIEGGGNEPPAQDMPLGGAMLVGAFFALAFAARKRLRTSTQYS